MDPSAIDPQRDVDAGPHRAPTVLRLVIPGEPRGKGRMQYRVISAPGRKPFAQEYKDKQTRAYEELIGLIARSTAKRCGWRWDENDRFSVVGRVTCTYPLKRPDLDNVLKSLLDGANKHLWTDDRHVVAFGMAFTKPDPKNPRVEIEVRRFPKGSA